MSIPHPPTTPRSAIYARYSSHSQDESTSIELQLDSCRRAAGEACREYIDRAKTGRVIAGRAALLQLLEDARAGLLDRLYVYKFDRLGRAAETHTIVADLEDAGVEVVSATEGKEALARGVQLVVAQHYSRALAERTRDGLIERFKAGCWTGGPAPYGYRVIDVDGRRRLAINPDEADVVRQLFRDYLAEPVGVKELARRLRERCIPTRTGVPWAFTTIRSILINRMLTGEVRFNRRCMKLDRVTGRRRPRRRAEAEHLVHHAPALQIIDPATFDAAQQRIRERAVNRSVQRPAKSIRPLTGLIWCGECGNLFYARRSKNRKGDYHYYACGLRQRSGPESCCNAATLREDKIVAVIGRAVGVVLHDADQIIEEALDLFRRRVGERKRQSARARGELAALDKQVAQLSRALIDPEIDPAAKRALSRQLGELEGRREMLVKVAMERANRGDDEAEGLVRYLRAAIEETRQQLADALSPAQQHQLVEDLLGPMLVTASGEIKPRPESTTTPAGAEVGVMGSIAGARSDTRRIIRGAVWALLLAA